MELKIDWTLETLKTNRDFVIPCDIGDATLEWSIFMNNATKMYHSNRVPLYNYDLFHFGKCIFTTRIWRFGVYNRQVECTIISGSVLGGFRIIFNLMLIMQSWSCSNRAGDPPPGQVWKHGFGGFGRLQMLIIMSNHNLSYIIIISFCKCG